MPVTHVVASVLTVNICQTCCLLEQRLTPADDTLCHVLQFMLVSGYFSLLWGGGGGGATSWTFHACIRQSVS